MTTAGWIFLVISWAAIVALCAFCFGSIFRKRAADHLVAPMEIEAELEEKESKR